MLKKKVQKFIDSLTMGIEKDTRLVLAALMTESLARTDPISSSDSYLFRLYNNYQLLLDNEKLDKLFSKNKNCIE